MLLNYISQLDYFKLEPRKTLPGYVDYSLIILRDSQRFGVTVATIFLCALAVIANIATIIVNIRR